MRADFKLFPLFLRLPERVKWATQITKNKKYLSVFNFGTLPDSLEVAISIQLTPNLEHR